MPNYCQTQPVKAIASEKERAAAINAGLEGSDLHRGMTEASPGRNTPFLISPEPFWIDADLYRQIEALGPQLFSFYEAANRLYLHSVRGNESPWVRDYLERGKTETVIDYQRMRRFRTDLPVVIRPDIIPTEEGLVVSELDSVPGGFGLLGALSREYTRLGYDVVGGEDGIPTRFWQSAAGASEAENPFLAVVVSDESEDYRGEMTWLTSRLQELGHRARTVHPRELQFTEEGLYLGTAAHDVEWEHGHGDRVDVLYRFFELFDLKNIPKSDLLLYAIRKELVRATPPVKSHLEEKLLFALLHHGELEDFWRRQMGADVFERCRQVFPPSWVVDSRPVPPHAVVPGLTVGGKPVSDWRRLKEASQKERELVLKPSGFSPDAWGSRGVMIGHDMSSEAWAAGVDQALAAFDTTPYVLQKFYKGKKYRVPYYDFEQDEMKAMNTRVRLCPYFFVSQGETHLAGMLATACPLNKKIIHGMTEAVMAPVAVLR